ncbi:mevalonate kinase [Streptomyces sp. B-S-A8]|uniref:mevalonate kinase n=1 Tax=Streptomyces solicavernae TaxID=3043614 RepID=A0ABT6S1J1_9ACTN|nr:mevalonate kinase [Streptomyces sp. B-S-A8]MDI3390552.1 mevalonate kinase [Streptomyces sp. B-S-A8]
MHRARSIGSGSAHAKAILLGEHAVVYGAPAIALPVPQLTVTASAGWSPDTAHDQYDVLFTMTGSASRPLVTEASDRLGRLVTEVKAFLGVTESPHLDVIVDCAIPPGRGLGSSAACARAIVLALADLFGREMSQSAAYDLVQTAERVAHGRASGVDARAVGASAPMMFQSGEVHEPLIGCDGLFIIADSGDMGRTKDAVELLRAGFKEHAGAQEKFLRRASELTDEARRALAEGRPEKLGACLTDNHELLRAAGLSTGRIDALVEAALAAGSLGAKITGGGLGGCAIALTRMEQARQVTRRLHEAGATQTWAVPLKGRSHHAR